MSEPNWLISLIIGGLLSIPISVIGNLLTPKVTNWLGERSLHSRKKKYSTLEEEYRRVEDLHKNPNKAYLTFARNSLFAISLSLFTVYLFACIGLIYIVFSATPLRTIILVLLFATIGVSTYIVGNIMINFAGDLNKVLSFEEYQKDTREKLKELHPPSPRQSQ